MEVQHSRRQGKGNVRRNALLTECCWLMHRQVTLPAAITAFGPTRPRRATTLPGESAQQPATPPPTPPPLPPAGADVRFTKIVAMVPVRDEAHLLVMHHICACVCMSCVLVCIANVWYVCMRVAGRQLTCACMCACMVHMQPSALRALSHLADAIVGMGFFGQCSYLIDYTNTEHF